MELDPVTNPSLLIPTNPPKGKNGRSTQSLLRRLEHLPSVNFQKLRLEKYIFLSIFTLAKLVTPLLLLGIPYEFSNMNPQSCYRLHVD